MAITKVPNFGITSATSSVATSQTTTSDSYTDLATTGPAVTLTTGTKALVIVTGQMKNGTTNRGAQMGFAVSGASSVSADSRSVLSEQGEIGGGTVGASSAHIVTLTAGSNTFTAKYQRTVGSGTATFANRSITVIDLGS